MHETLCCIGKESPCPPGMCSTWPFLPVYLCSCPDLEEYVKEVDETKELLILVNKADFLPQHFRYETECGMSGSNHVTVVRDCCWVPSRKAWSEYFDSVGVSYLFFSAKLEQERIDAAERDMTLTASGLTKLEEVLNESPDALLDQLAHTVTDEDEDHSGDGDDIVDEDEADELVEGEATDSEHDGHPSALYEREKWSIMGREELIDFLVSKQKELVQPEESEHTEDEETDGEYEDSAMPLRPLVVGMVGYPNVGKSSTINALLGASTLAHGMKRVSVGSTPGKTKHFQVSPPLCLPYPPRNDGPDALQTLMLCPQVTLCDCPGLVFPSFVNSSAEMVCNGILPIAHLRDHMGTLSSPRSSSSRVCVQGCCCRSHETGLPAHPPTSICGHLW
jgi:large subunit GTPase 1